MAGVLEIRGGDALSEELDALLGQFPQMRRELLERMGRAAELELEAQLAASGMKDGGRKVRQWQVKQIGSGGGYVAIRPGKGDHQKTPGSKPQTFGRMTAALEEGHKIRGPRGGKGYRPRIKVSYVSGFHFYEAARTSFEAKAIRMVEDFADKLAGRLEG